MIYETLKSLRVHNLSLDLIKDTARTPQDLQLKTYLIDKMSYGIEDVETFLRSFTGYAESQIVETCAELMIFKGL